MFNYLGSERFNPKTKVSAEQIRALFSAPSEMERLGARVFKASSEEQGFEAANAIDGNANTMWHTAYQNSKPSHPHELQIQFNATTALRGFKITPRQDGNRNGAIKDFAIYVSNDTANWGEPAAQGLFPRNDAPKTITFSKPVRGRFVRFVALSGFDGQPYAAVAELALLPER
jgi:beta-galactosidase